MVCLCFQQYQKFSLFALGLTFPFLVILKILRCLRKVFVHIQIQRIQFLFNGFSFFLLFFVVSFMFFGVLQEVEFFVIYRILILSPVFLYLLQVPWRFAESSVLCHFSDSQSFFFFLSPSSSLALSTKLRSLSLLGFSFFLLFFFISFKFLGVLLKLSPLSFLGFSFALLFFFISFMFLCVLLEVALYVIFGLSFSLLFFSISFNFLGVLLEVQFFVLSRILIRSPVFLYLLHVPWRFPGICVLCPFSDS